MDRRALFLIIALGAVATGVDGPGVRAQGQIIKLNGGLEAEITALGRHQQFLTVSMTISNPRTNPTRNIAYLLLAGDHPPMANDNTGVTFNALTSVSGIATCPSSSISACIGVPSATSGTPPLQNWTELDPGTSITVNFQLFTSYRSRGPLVSFSASVAYRTVADHVQDDALTEAQKREQIRTMTISFPPSPVVDQP
jgi:hypothetical protein